MTRLETLTLFIGIALGGIGSVAYFRPEYLVPALSVVAWCVPMNWMRGTYRR